MMAAKPILFHPLSPFFHPQGVKEVCSKKGLKIKKKIISWASPRTVDTTGGLIKAGLERFGAHVA